MLSLSFQEIRIWLISLLIEFQADSLTNKEINNIKNFILESDINISDKDIEVIYEEY